MDLGPMGIIPLGKAQGKASLFIYNMENATADFFVAALGPLP